MNFASEQIFLTEVQHNLVELEGLIAHQKGHEWSEPNLVTKKLGDVLDGMLLGIITGEQLGVISMSDRESLYKLYTKLKQFPHDELYSFVNLTEEDKANYEKLQEKLRAVGLGLRITVFVNMKSFMNQVEELEKKIEYPLVN